MDCGILNAKDKKMSAQIRQKAFTFLCFFKLLLCLSKIFFGFCLYGFCFFLKQSIKEQKKLLTIYVKRIYKETLQSEALNIRFIPLSII